MPFFFAHPGTKTHGSFDIFITASIHLTNAKQRVDAVRRVLGPNERWTLIRSHGAPQTQRWTWKCGCVLDCIGAGDREHVLQWDGCGSHIQLGRESF
jgi:hypothetical protein